MTYDEWKLEVNEIAESEGLVPKEHLWPGEDDVWKEQYNKGKTPQQAWKAVPYQNSIGGGGHLIDVH